MEVTAFYINEFDTSTFLRTRVFSFDEIGSVYRFSTIDSNNMNS